MTTHRTIAVVTAGLSQPSSTRLLADRLAQSAVEELAQRGVTAEVRTVELRDVAHDVVNMMLTGFPSAPLKDVLDTVTGADGLVAVTPLFTTSYSGLFKSFVDVLDKDSLVGMPVLIGATGGTARHSLVLDHALRPLFSYLKAVVVPTGVYAASEDWGAEGLDGRIERAAGELAALMAGLSTARPLPGRDSFEEVVPFEERLAALRPTG